jgi:hypothetical protein
MFKILSVEKTSHTEEFISPMKQSMVSKT